MSLGHLIFFSKDMEVYFWCIHAEATSVLEDLKPVKLPLNLILSQAASDAVY